MEALQRSLRDLAERTPQRYSGYETVVRTLDQIDEARAAGLPTARILEALRSEGLVLSYGTFEQYLYKARRERSEGNPHPADPKLSEALGEAMSRRSEPIPIDDLVEKGPSDGADFDRRIRALGFSQVGFAEWSGIGARTVRSYVSAGPPPSVSRLVAALESVRRLSAEIGRGDESPDRSLELADELERMAEGIRRGATLR